MTVTITRKMVGAKSATKRGWALPVGVHTALGDISGWLLGHLFREKVDRAHNSASTAWRRKPGN